MAVRAEHRSKFATLKPATLWDEWDEKIQTSKQKIFYSTNLNLCINVDALLTNNPLIGISK